MDSMGITIHKATNSDIPKIVNIIHEAFAQYKDNLIPPSGAHKETIQTIEEKMKEGGAYISKYEKESVGCALWKNNEYNLYIGRLAVLPKYRKLGIGGQLIEILEKKAVKIGYSKVLIGVRLSMPTLLDYYKKKGYEIIEYCYHEGYKEPTYVRMVKKL
jgi:predicted N-acetyltransferase YhbS